MKAQDQSAEREALLKPCPFCVWIMPPDEGDNLIDTLYPSGTWWREDSDVFRYYVSHKEHQPGDHQCWGVHCECGAQVSGDSREETVAAWNRRAALSAREAPATDIAQKVALDIAKWIVQGDTPDEWKLKEWAESLDRGAISKAYDWLEAGRPQAPTTDPAPPAAKAVEATSAVPPPMDIAERLRRACRDVRTKSLPLASLIPLMQRAADALDAALSKQGGKHG